MIKNKIKKLSIVALTGLVAVGAYAFIKDSRVQSGTNLIKPGVISITFDNEADAISLSGNETIPMSNDYAKANLVSYKFNIVNDGDVALDYIISADNIYGNLNPLLVDIMLKDGEGDMEYKTSLAFADNELTNKDNMLPGETHSYELIAHMNDNVKLGEYTGKNISFGLKVEAEQHTNSISAGGDLPGIDENGILNVLDSNYVDPQLAGMVLGYNNYNGEFTQEARESVNSIFLSYSNKDKLTSLKGIEYFPNLETIKIQYASQLTEVDLSHNTKLKNIQISDGGALETLILGDNQNLETLNVYNNKLSGSFSLTNIPNLKSVNIGINNFSSVDLSNNPNLTSISVGANKIENIDVSGDGELMNLNLFNNKLKDIDLSTNTKLESLNVQMNNLTELDLSSNPLLNSSNVSVDSGVNVVYAS